MGSAGIVEVDPVSDYSGCVLKAFEAMPVDAFLFECPDYAFDHSVLLRAVRGDELLFQAIASNKTGVIAARKNQAIVRSKQEGVLNSAK